MLTSYTCFCLLVADHQIFHLRDWAFRRAGGGVCRLEQSLLHRGRIRTGRGSSEFLGESNVHRFENQTRQTLLAQGPAALMPHPRNLSLRLQRFSSAVD